MADQIETGIRGHEFHWIAAMRPGDSVVRIYDEDGDRRLALFVDDGEMPSDHFLKSVCDAYRWGHKKGVTFGEYKKAAEIRKVLGVKE